MSNDHTNWKRLADRTGMPIGTIRRSLKGLSGRRRQKILETLTMPSDGRDSRKYAHAYSLFDSNAERINVDTANGSLWEALQEAWQYNVVKKTRWRQNKEFEQPIDSYDEKSLLPTYEEDTFIP